ncbi:MAG: adenylate/guanylate cyclase domain-containing protein [Candidatus Poribacteria bacterium]
MTQTPVRKLAVLLHADIVGSTSLVQNNETIAHERIQDAFHRLSATISSYGGIAHEIRGDALVAEFARASDAVTASLAFQATNTTHNEQLSDDIRPMLRIGIAMGEVVVADSTVTGEGIVLAQRLEQLAGPGGVVVQGSVSETVPSRMPFEFESLGEQELKGFDQPVRAFSASLRSGEEIPAPEVASSSGAAEQSTTQPLSKLPSESYEALIGERFELPDKPSIAVLPFQNMSGDPEQEYFADGMSEDIITTLSRVPGLFVIANKSTRIYKEREVDIKDVSRDQGVRYVLEGGIRKVGDQVRVTVQLIDSVTGLHIWAERYQRILDDIFAVQDEITHSIVIELQVKLVAGEHSRSIATSTKSVEAWELVIRAESLIDSNVRDEVIAAKQILTRALEIDNNYPAAWTNLGWVYWNESVWKWSSDPEKSMALAMDAVQKAISADADYPMGYSLLGSIHMSSGDVEQAITESEKAVELAPGNSHVLAILGNVLIDSGRLKEGIRAVQKAIRLCPYPPAWYLGLLGAGLHLNRDNEAAIPVLERAVDDGPESYTPRLWLACALVELGRLEEAGLVSKIVLDIEPNFSAAGWAESFKSKTHAQLKDNMLAAGFPE